MSAAQQDILAQIVSAKTAEAALGEEKTPLAEVRAAAAAVPPPRPFAAALAAGGERLPVIAEIKKRSPSKGVLCDSFDPRRIAGAYHAAGAACLSVLTDAQFFGGSGADLLEAHFSCPLPALRKDFMLTEWQIYESRALRADAVLLIAAILDDAALHQLALIAQTLQMAVLVEVHNAAELQRALSLPPPILLGINNRDLKTFHTDLRTTLDLIPLLPRDNPPLLVSESGIRSRDDIARLRRAGVDAFLIGETLMRDPQNALQKLFE